LASIQGSKIMDEASAASQEDHSHTHNTDSTRVRDIQDSVFEKVYFHDEPGSMMNDLVPRGRGSIADMSKWFAVATLLVAMCMVGESGASGTACLSGIALRGSGAVKECGYSVVRGCSVVEGRMLRLRGGEDEEEAGGEEDAADAGMAGDEDVEEEEEEEEEEEGMNMNKAVKQVALSTLPPPAHASSYLDPAQKGGQQGTI